MELMTWLTVLFVLRTQPNFPSSLSYQEAIEDWLERGSIWWGLPIQWRTLILSSHMQPFLNVFLREDVENKLEWVYNFSREEAGIREVLMGENMCLGRRKMLGGERTNQVVLSSPSISGLPSWAWKKWMVVPYGYLQDAYMELLLYVFSSTGTL